VVLLIVTGLRSAGGGEDPRVVVTTAATVGGTAEMEEDDERKGVSFSKGVGTLVVGVGEGIVAEGIAVCVGCVC
jgi:hypothetical protein